MASIYSWESFIRIHGGEPGARVVFDRVIEELLRAENPGKEVHLVKASHGDGGIDVYVHQENGIDIYQCKFFMGSMNPSRWNQVKDSFSKAMEPKGVKVLRWVLCMPREMQMEDIARWVEFKKDRESNGVEIQVIDGNEIIYRMRDCDRDRGTDLIDRYFAVPQEEIKGIDYIPPKYPKCLTSIPMGSDIGLVGRDSVIQYVRSILDQPTQTVQVTGIAGIGKTAVMQRICEMILTDGNDKNHVAWISCGVSLEDDLLNLREELGVSMEYNKDEAFNAIFRELKAFPETLYIFMDNMERIPNNKELGILAALRPNVYIMITSRHTIKGIPNVELSALKESDVIEMFYSYYERDKERKYSSDVMRIINSEAIGCNTLLVELVAKAANRSFETLDVFCKNLELKGTFELSKSKLSTAHDENLTIEETIIKLYDISELSFECKRIMSLFSIFTPGKEIYGKVVEWAGFDEDDIEQLVRLAWLSRTERGYLIHPLVKDVIARQIGNSVDIGDYGELLERVADTDSYIPLSLEYTIVRDRLVLAEDVARYINGRIDSLLNANKHSKDEDRFLQNSALLMHNLGEVNEAQGEYKKALEYFEKALEIRERVLGRNHPETAATYNGLGSTYYAQGEYEKALEYYVKAFDVNEWSLGSDHPDIASTYNDIAEVYQAQGEYEKALEYCLRALEIRERVLGSNHPDTAATYNNMAEVYNTLGEYEKSLEYCGKSLEVRERVLGSNHPGTAATYNNMAEVYNTLGEYEKSLEYYGKSLEVRERVLGSNHPDTAATYNNMAEVYSTLGEYEKSLEYYGKALEVRERVLGSNHPDTATTYNNMAEVYNTLGEYGEALKYCEKALKIRKRALGSDHPDTATTYNNMAEVYNALGECEEALKYCEKALKTRKRVLGDDHPDTATTYNNMAIVYRKQGNYEKALEYAEKARRIRERVLGSNHPSIAATNNNIGGVFYAQGDYEKALKYFKEALDINEYALGRNHLLTAMTYSNVANAYYAQGDYAIALENYEKALVIFETVLGTNHSLTITTNEKIASVYREQGDYEKALDFYKRILFTREQLLGKNSSDAVSINKNIEALSNINNVQDAYGDQEDINSIDQQGVTRDSLHLTLNQKKTLAVLALVPRNNCSSSFLLNILGGEKVGFEKDIQKLSQMEWINEESGVIFANSLFLSSEHKSLEQIQNNGFYKDLLSRYLTLPANQMNLNTDFLSAVLDKLQEEETDEIFVASILCNKAQAIDYFFEKYPKCGAACIYVDTRNRKRSYNYYDLNKHEKKAIYSVKVESNENLIGLLGLYSKNQFELDFSFIDNEKRIDEIPADFCCNNAFLTRLALPKNINRIGARAFYGCTNLKGDLVLPNSIVVIESEAFCGCNELSGDIYLPDKIEEIRERAFAGCNGLSGNLYLSNNIKAIGDDAFNYQYRISNSEGDDLAGSINNSIGKIFLPKDMTQIRNSAYRGFTGLYGEIHFEEGVISIGDWAFMGCTHLFGNLSFPESLERIGNNAFDGCFGLSGRLELNKCKNLTEIGSYAFRQCVNLTGNIVLPNTVTKIGDYAFGECCSFTGELKIPDNMSVLCDGTFYGCENLTKVTFNSKLKRIGDKVFCGCKGLISISDFPDSLILIDDEAFKDCKALSGELHFREGLAVIGDRSFMGCESLQGEIHVPNSIFSVGLDAFWGCTRLMNNKIKGRIYKSREYIKALFWKEDPIPLNQCKVVFLGFGGAGKSLAISRLMNNGDKDPDFNGDSTPGIKVTKHEEMVGKNQFVVYYWDFGGQEMFYSMHRMFMTQRALYVVFLNARDNLQDESVEHWLRDISIYAPDSPILLVINHIDQNKTASINEKRLRELYPKLRKTIKLSALTYTKEQFNSELTNSIHSLIEELPEAKIAFPATWKNFLDSIDSDTHNYINSKSFNELCQYYGISEYEDVQKLLTDKIQDLGLGISYKGKEFDKFVMLLEPKWLLNAIYIILFNGKSYSKNGVLSHKALYEMLCKKEINNAIIRKTDKEKRYKKKEVNYILKVLRKYRLSYQKDKHSEFFPMLCERNQKITLKEIYNADSMHMIIRYTYEPLDVFHRLIVEMHRDLDSDNVWYSGAILRYKEKQIDALINVIGNDLHFQVICDGKNDYADDYFMIIHNQISSINSLLGVSAEELVVYHEDGQYSEHFYDDLIGSKESGIDYIYSRALKKKLYVKEILKYSDSELIEYHKILLNKILEALQKLQNNRMYFSRKENDRNSYVRDLLEMCNYTCKDQTLGGVSGTENEAGELDILIKKAEGENKQLEIVTIYEALILKSFTSADKKNVNSHVKKLLKNYNQIGCPILYLVTYAEWKIDEFSNNSQLYFSFVQNGIDSSFNVTSIGQIEQTIGQYICYRKITYDCGGIPFSVFHILVRIEDSPEEELKKSICKLAKEKGIITKADIERSFMVSETKASKILKILCESGKLIRKYENRKAVYYPIP